MEFIGVYIGDDREMQGMIGISNGNGGDFEWIGWGFPMEMIRISNGNDGEIQGMLGIFIENDQDFLHEQKEI